MFWETLVGRILFAVLVIAGVLVVVTPLALACAWVTAHYGFVPAMFLMAGGCVVLFVILTYLFED